ncbi:protein kinase [Rhodococcus sp. ACS1]|uniref:serine/threonine-protein kinase n=1 Tax=Rhodococcus sp. ACS1 TaxID=2028570 RepID=UPI000BB14BCF|nr:serine/threonine-protein kinase [Rhodococcus sp. ACS1]PBC50049.1 protein kinase [Rhodococcus sp. ACS1]
MADDRWATQREPDIAVELSAAGFDDAVEIGRGGFGVVYRCVQEDLDRTVAVKVLTTDLDRENLARFVREQRAMGRMSGHPNIVDLYQVGITRSDRPFLVMPYHEHGSLDAQIRTTGPIGWESTVRLGVKIAGALETAHRAGTLHRDVKPANILLTEYNEPQLTDFGIARVSGGFETAAGSITGSPAFTAPEVLEGRPPTVASDVYSLGATLFCALTGHAAFERRSGEQVVAQFLRISSQPVPDLRDTGIPNDVCGALERAMARSVEKRPGSAAEFGDQLRVTERTHGMAVDHMHVPAQRTPRQPPGKNAEATEAAPPLAPKPTPRPYPVQTPRTPPVPLTKFRPPTTTRKLVRRHRLLDELRASRGCRLTLVHGPAGFGKSSLVAQWRDELVAAAVTVAWLTVDSDDDNAVWFLSHLIEAIRRVRAEVVGDLGQALEEQGQSVERFVLTSLINRLHESGDPLVVVIDDWHRVTAPTSIAVMEFLLDHGCHHLQIIVASRSRSGLPLSRMRVHDELKEINSTALGFDFAESRDFFAERMQTPLTDSDVEELRASTDGWIAALQLASLSLRESGGPDTLLERFRAGTDTLGEYLAENVLDALEPDLLDFVLATAVPERVCGELASALADVPDGAARLEQVVARDLFLGRAAEDRRWYRYHHLFAQILRQRLERDHPDRIAALHRRAASWFRERHLLGEALHHTLATGDRTAAVRLLEDDSLYLLDRSQMSTLLGLIDKLPADWVLSSPRLQLTIGWANTELQRLDVAANARRRTLELLDTLDLPDDERAQLQVEANVLQADIRITADHAAGVKDLVAECLTHAHDHHPFVVSLAALIATIVDTYEFHFDEAYDRQTWAAPYHRKTTGPYSVAYGYCFAGMARAEQLDIAGASELYHRAFDLVREAGNTQSQHARLTRALLAEELYLQDRIEEAAELLGETSDAASLGGASDFMIRHYCLGARIRSVRGDHTGAGSLLDEGIRTAHILSLPRLRAAVDGERVRLGLPPRPRFVPVTRGTRREPVDGIERVTAELEDEAAILLLVRSGDAEQIRIACEWAGDWLRALDGTERAMARLHAGRLLATCLWAAGRADDAHEALLPVVAHCARHGLIRFLPDGGPETVTALRSLRERLSTVGVEEHPEITPSFVDRVLGSFG